MSTPANAKRPLSYKDAGVDIDAGNALVERIKPAVARTRRPEVLAGLGGFGALFALPPGKYHEPVLVSGTDGVGTKLKLAQILNRHETIGIDLVAMCVNDVLVQGAEPLFFLDYFATGKLDVNTAATVIEGIAKGCELAGCALVGGETAEMPDMYAPGEYDLAGFTVGVVERKNIIDGSRIRAGQVVLGIASSGPHSNGYSLIRKVMSVNGADPQGAFGDTTLADALMRPTTIYVKAIFDVLSRHTIAGMAHITGGGLLENIIRVVPDDLNLHLQNHSWPRPPIFQWLKSAGEIAELEMLRTFNCGIGFTLIIDAEQVTAVQTTLQAHDLASWVIGRVETPNDAADANLAAPNRSDSRVRFE
jgi:phosphoribosylformylglycinamidine cyclo-ligase